MDRRADAPGGERSAPAAVWLAIVAALILAMVVVGGATRVTGSGLSITQWKPVSGVVPPLTRPAWVHLFDLYQATPQYRLLNRGMSLVEFQTIFWWEWSHRLLGRLVGFAFLAPFVALVALKRLPRRLIWRCILLFGLGGLQGAVGWWMVQSGLENRTSVAPERLATHLGLALALCAAIVWTALEAWSGPNRRRLAAHKGWRMAGAGVLAGVFCQCLLGAFVAGNHAGLVDADWPLMAGRWIPADYWQGGIWPTLAHGPAAVQFNHRLMAYALLIFVSVVAMAAWRDSAVARLRPLAGGLALGLVFQAALGVAALLLVVPPGLAILHQLTAALLLVLATALAWTTRRV